LGTPVNPLWDKVLVVFKGHEHKLSNVLAKATPGTVEMELDKIDLDATTAEVRYDDAVECEDIGRGMPIFYKHEGKFIVFTGRQTVETVKTHAKPKPDGKPITVTGRLLSSVALKSIRIVKDVPVEPTPAAAPFNPPRFTGSINPRPTERRVPYQDRPRPTSSSMYPPQSSSSRYDSPYPGQTARTPYGKSTKKPQ